MSSSSSTTETLQERLLKMLNKELNATYTSVIDALAALQEKDKQTPVGICGFRCDGSCSTCKQTEASLEAFFNPETRHQSSEDKQQMAYTGDAQGNEEMDEEMRQARAMDEMEEIQRANLLWVDDRDQDEYSDDGYGMDWNESGYFD